MKISAVIITFNEEKNLVRCLKSLSGLVEELVVVDSGSEDRTKDVAESFGARFIYQRWKGYVAQKNFAINQAKYEWILNLDADEELSEELRSSLTKFKNEKSLPGITGYRVTRVVFFRGKWIRHGDWYPDYLVRFFQKTKGRFEGGKVHERLQLEGGVVSLSGELNHYTYTDANDRRDRLRRYAKLWAESKYEEGKRVSVVCAYAHALWTFFRGLILKRGCLDGILGIEIAWGNAWGVYLKYKYLYQLDNSRHDEKDKEGELK
ncbi:MAG: glycosyltransferase family 2 protein [Verrucomicrobiota bacterium]